MGVTCQPLWQANFLPLTTSHPLSYPQAQAPFFVSVAMSETLPTPPSPSFFAFQAIYFASMKEYEKKTKKDLLARPLMAQLQTCNSPTDILAVLRTQVQRLDRCSREDDKLTK